MNCTHAKRLILTDYLDGEAAESVRRQVASHLAGCAACRDFERTVRDKVSEPLHTLKPSQPPEEVWQHIRQSIEAEQQAGYEPEDLYAPTFSDRLRDLYAGVFAARRPALAFAAALSLIVLFVGVFNPVRRQQALVTDYLKEQRMFLASADRPYNGMLDDDFTLGTRIEKFLF